DHAHRPAARGALLDLRGARPDQQGRLRASRGQGMRGLRRGLVSVAAATALLGGASVPAVMLAPVASAHSVLISTDPADGSEVPESPEQVSLTFNEEINQHFVTVTVRQADDPTIWVAGEPTVDGDTVNAQVEDLEPGE